MNRAKFLSAIFLISVGFQVGAADRHAPRRLDTIELVKSRALVQHYWQSMPVELPCREEVLERKAAAEKAHKPFLLPYVAIHGETHTDPYCRERKSLLYQQLSAPTNHLCLALEGVNAPDGSDADTKVIKGLENPYVAEMNRYLIAIETLHSLAAAGGNPSSQDPYDIDLSAISFTGPVLAKLVEGSGKKECTLKDSCQALAEPIAKLKEWLSKPHSGTERSKDLEEIRQIFLKHPGEFAGLIEDAVMEVARDLESRLERGAVREKVPFPVGLADQVQYAVELIRKSAASPTALLLRAEKDPQKKYLRVQWQDQLMAFNIAQLWCENFLSETPRSQIQAIVGSSHLNGITAALQASFNDLRIPMIPINASDFAGLHRSITGIAEEGGAFAPRAAQKIYLGDREVGVAMQTGGARIAFVKEFPDLLPGAALNNYQGRPFKMFIMGPQDKVTQVYSSRGFPVYDQSIVVGSEKYLEFMKSWNKSEDELYEYVNEQVRKSAQDVTEFPWVKK